MCAVFKVLEDSESRKVYDESGEILDEETNINFSDDGRDWDKYWRLHFNKITLDDIENFEAAYKNSEEESGDLKSAYVEGDGDIDFIFNNVLCADEENDRDRFVEAIRGWIEAGDVPTLPRFEKSLAAFDKKAKARKRKAAKEAKEAEELAKEFGLGRNGNSLEAAIMKRQEARAKESDAFLEQLAQKYAKKEKKKK